MSQTFKGGIPYAIDVNRLKESFPTTELVEGRIIKHEELEKIVQVARGTQRYYGVINAWLGHVKNSTGIVIIWEQRLGLKVLNPGEILEYAETITKQKIGQTARAIKTFGWVDRNRLDAVGQQRLDHQMRIASVMKEALTTAKKQLAVELSPVKSLPKPTVIRDKMA